MVHRGKKEKKNRVGKEKKKASQVRAGQCCKDGRAASPQIWGFWQAQDALGSVTNLPRQLHPDISFPKSLILKLP